MMILGGLCPPSTSLVRPLKPVHMAVYRGGDDLAQRIRIQSFDKDKKPLKPHRATDSLHRLHERLGCHKQYSIPIRFFYAKWSEKLHFHFDRIRAQKPT